jgi:hypothetical protein
MPMVRAAFAPVWAHNRARTGDLTLDTEEHSNAAYERERGEEPQQAASGSGGGEGSGNAVELSGVHDDRSPQITWSAPEAD